jgi:biopolymer transport protein ExbD
VFATLAITRAALYDTDVNLVKINALKQGNAVPSSLDAYVINLSVTDQGEYRWVTEFNEYVIKDVSSIKKEIFKQQELGLLPKDKQLTKVLLHIDKKAEWDPIAQLIFAIRDAGFQIHPVYEPDDHHAKKI